MLRKAIASTVLTLGLATAQSITVGLSGEPVSLDPSVTADGNSAYVQQQIYNSLISFKPGTIELQPGLANRWTVSPDGLTWTFYLRSNVKFQDGTSFDADAVKFNFTRWWDTEDPNGMKDTGKSFIGWKNNLGGYKGEAGSILKDVRVRNKTTVELILTKPYPALGAVLADAGLFGMASPTAVRKAGAKYGTPAALPVGTGPFIAKRWTTGNSIELAKNPTYYKANLPKSEALIFRFVPEPTQRLNELRTGGIDIASDLLPDQYEVIKNDPQLKEVLRAPLNVGYLGLNTSVKPLNDIRVRQAIAMALNKKEIVSAFWNGLGITDGHLTPPPMAKAQSSKVKDYEFNPQKAKELLRQAGYPNGFDLELWYMPVSRPYFPTPKPIAEALAADLSAIGVKVSLRTQDWASYLADREKGKFQAFMLGMVYATDPDTAYTFLVGPGATADLGGWSNADVTRALEAARKLSSEAQRNPHYQKIDEIVFNEVIRIPIVHARLLAAQRAPIKGWIPSPTGSESLEGVEK